MTAKWILGLTVLCLPAVLKAQKGEVESFIPANPIVVDADFSDWQGEWMADTKGKFAYTICNDADNLYVRLKISDEMTQRKVGIFGMTLFLNPKGKKVGKMGLKFPVQKDLDELKKNAPTEKISDAKVEELKMNLVRNEEVLELVGFSKETIVSSRVGLMNGIEVIIKPGEHGTFAYEAKIPFKAFQINPKNVKVLGVAFVSGKMAVKNPTSSTAPTGGGVGNSGYANRYGMMGGYGGYGGYNRTSVPQWSEWNSPESMLIGVKLK